MKEYQEILRQIMEHGSDREGRNGMTRAIFARQARFHLDEGFPAMTTKRLAFKAVTSELLWFLEGSSDDNRLKQLNGSERTIWTDNAEADYWKPKAKFPGDLGRIYGVQWRRWLCHYGRTVDQLAEVIERLKKNPSDRRHVVTAWNPGEIEQMALPPCHMLFQFFVADGRLSVHAVQRSCDMFLGVPFNIASYALLLAMVAHVTGYKPGACVLTFNDAHIYHEHFPAVREQLNREPMTPPHLWLNPNVTSIDGFTPEDIKLIDYESHPPIKAKMIV